MYQSFIGLEIHIQLLTKSKVFCSCRAAFGDEPNSNVCPVCMGYPGTLPTLNVEAMRLSYLVAKALNCTLNPNSLFDRKNYYYPDLPKNYQITQFASPVGMDGYVDLDFRKSKKRVRIKECHLEEDAGKMIHAGDMSLLDYNRTGTPLLEIVTEPDLEIGEEAEVFLQKFRRMVRYLGVCDGNMEEGSMRCDANVSVNIRGNGLGRKVEVKNLNSSRFVKKAINFEIERQQEILERNGIVTQETRLWNENRDCTESMRSKENANDYRYFPEPDLPPFRPDAAFLASVENAMVELPEARMERYVREYGLNEVQAEAICDEKSMADFFEDTVKLGADPLQVVAWIGSDVKKMLNRQNIGIAASPLTPERLNSLLTLLSQGKIHGKIAKTVLEAVFDEDKDPRQIIKEQNLEQMTDRSQLEPIINEVLSAHDVAVTAIRAGDDKPMGFLVGQIMKKTGGRAEPKLVQDILRDMLSVRFIQVLSMGGSIAGRKEDGRVVGGVFGEACKLLNGDANLPSEVRFSALTVTDAMSEELTPVDWAELLNRVQTVIQSGSVSGIVIGHGTDTLPYTASLLYWALSDAGIPVVIAASSISPADADQAAELLRPALNLCLEKKNGVYAVVDGVEYSPVNLKFEKVSQTGGFRNWNGRVPVNTPRGMVVPELLVKPDFSRLVEAAANRIFLAKVYPGMRSEWLISIMQSGVKFVILELYDTGTGNLTESAYSLKDAIEYGKEHGISFFCTSQQEGIVDFSSYTAGHDLWREGVVPMGRMTTESAYTRLLAAILASEKDEEIVHMMEDSDESAYS